MNPRQKLQMLLDGKSYTIKKTETKTGPDEKPEWKVTLYVKIWGFEFKGTGVGPTIRAAKDIAAEFISQEIKKGNCRQ